MSTKIKFPYTMHCPKCKAGLKIKAPSLVGTRINCPKCKARIDVVTPDEDAVVSYGVEAAPEPEKLPEPTEEELLEAALEVKRKKRKEVLRQTWYWLTVLWLIALVSVGVYVIWNYAIVPFSEEDFTLPDEGETNLPSEFR